ncbi:MAG: restriction endonuclease subunit S [Bacteroidales bacterium]|nr:restriction endonuclease subunit S [Bacteroidales bacterium]
MADKQTDKYLPKLRFPEFKDEGEWKIMKVKDVCSIETGKSNTQDQVNDGKYPFFIRSENPVRSDKYLYDCEAVITIGDGKIGQVYHYINGKFDLHQRCYKMSDFKGVDGKYFYYYFSSHFYERAMRMSAKATVDSVRLEMIADMPIAVPCIKEQRAIASLFSSLDECITASKEKMEQLKAHKKGLMQKLFPAPGKTLLEYRFPEFKDEGEWKIMKVKDVCSIETGKSNTQDQVNDGKYPFFIRSENPVRSDKYLYDCEAVITIGDGKIGQVYHYINGKFDLHQRCYKMSDFKGVDGKYFYYYFSSHFYERAMRMSAKATVDSVRLEMIADMPIAVPCIKEQRAIASLFSSLDECITASKEKLDQLKAYKRGLMQQMFPLLY